MSTRTVAALVAAVLAIQPVAVLSFDLQACFRMMEDALDAVVPRFDKVPTSVTKSEYEAIVKHAFVALMTECARRACKADVRECVNVRQYEETEQRLREALPKKN